MANVFSISAVMALGLSAVSCSGDRPASITQNELVRRTQEILNGVTTGDRKPFDRYFADDALVHDEKGRGMTKRALVADMSPPPADWSGSLVLTHPRSLVATDTAVLSYDLDETETISGQQMRARYHTTDTWLRRKGRWQIVAEQALRYYEDPAPGRVEIAKYPDFVGAYELVPGKTREVSSEGVDLFSQRLSGTKELLLPESGDVFFRKGVEGRVLFRRDEKGKVNALIDRRNNEDIIWRKTR